MRNVLREGLANAAVMTRLARQTGFLWALTQPGALTLLRVFASGSQNPSLIYRVHAANSPDKAALVWRGRTTTWRELDDRIARIASGLERRGLGRGKSFVMMTTNRPEAVELAGGATRAGAAAVSIPYRSTPSELAYFVNHSGASAIFLEESSLGVLEAARADLPEEALRNVFVVGGTGPRSFDSLLSHAPDSPSAPSRVDPSVDAAAAVVVYTSGTTGKPKGAVRKFPRDTMQAAMRFINETPLRVDDVHLVVAPLYHSTAFGFLALSQMLGNTAVLEDHFDAEGFLALVERHRVTTTAMVPTMLHRILDLPEAVRRRYDTRSLRIVFTGGAPVPAPLALEFMDAFGDVLHVFYGATETGLVTLARPQDLRAAPTTIGRAIPGNDIRILGEDKRDVEPETVGELYVRSKLLVAGYHGDEEATRASMVDGFFSVGDLARRDRFGRFFIEGRKRDMVISGGVNVYPAEVEGILGEHPDVAEVAVVGVPDREWGEKVRAFVVLRPGRKLDADALTAFAKTRLSGAKVPRDFQVLDALPRNPTGKVLKRELRQRP